MKLLNVFLVLLLLVGLTACSSGEKGKDAKAKDSETALEGGSEDEEFMSDDEGEGDEELFAEDSEGGKKGEDDSLEDDKGLDNEEDLFADEPVQQENKTQPVASNNPPPVQISNTGGMGSYVVERGDTLMLIAFKLYGDYERWRDILNANPGLSARSISAGSTIRYNMPSERFEWNPTGNPHLIQNGETLGTISSDKYGTSSRWRDIYNNNRPMIKNPNLIFAGFTLYYIPGNRDVASGI
jgi:nucleoid-associated protein YgaU